MDDYSVSKFLLCIIGAVFTIWWYEVDKAHVPLYGLFILCITTNGFRNFSAITNPVEIICQRICVCLLYLLGGEKNAEKVETERINISHNEEVTNLKIENQVLKSTLSHSDKLNKLTKKHYKEMSKKDGEIHDLLREKAAEAEGQRRRELEDADKHPFKALGSALGNVLDKAVEDPLFGNFLFQMLPGPKKFLRRVPSQTSANGRFRPITR